MSAKLFIFCAGGHTKQVVDVFRIRGVHIDGIFDDFKKKGDVYYYDYKILDTVQNARKYLSVGDMLFCGVGDNVLRGKIYEQFKDYEFVNCVSPLANISMTSSLAGQGNYVGHFVNVLGDTKIGSFNILNDGATITHDVVMGDFNHIAPRACLCGTVKIGNYNLIGANSTVIQKICVGNNNIVGAGCVVIRDIEDSCTVVGNPGKVIKVSGR